MNGDGEDGTTTFPDDPKADPMVGVGGPDDAVEGNDPWLGMGGVNRLKGWPIVVEEGAVAAVKLGLNGWKGWLKGLVTLEPLPLVTFVIFAGVKELDDPDETAGDFEMEFNFELPNGVEGLIPVPVPVLINLWSAEELVDGDDFPSDLKLLFFSSIEEEEDLTWDPFTVDGIELTSEATIASEEVKPSFEQGGDGTDDSDCCFSDAINSLEADEPLLCTTLDSTSINDSVPESWPPLSTLSWLLVVELLDWLVALASVVHSFLMSESLIKSSIEDPLDSDDLWLLLLPLSLLLLLLVAVDLLLAGGLRSLFGTFLMLLFFNAFLDFGPGDRLFLLTFDCSLNECSSSVDEEDETEDEFLEDSPEDNEWLFLLLLLIGDSVPSGLGDDELDDDLWEDVLDEEDFLLITPDDSMSQELVDIVLEIKAGFCVKIWHLAADELLLPLDLITDSPSDSYDCGERWKIF